MDVFKLVFPSIIFLGKLNKFLVTFSLEWFHEKNNFFVRGLKRIIRCISRANIIKPVYLAVQKYVTYLGGGGICQKVALLLKPI